MGARSDYYLYLCDVRTPFSDKYKHEITMQRFRIALMSLVGFMLSICAFAADDTPMPSDSVNVQTGTNSTEKVHKNFSLQDATQKLGLKFSGYVVTQYTYSDQKYQESNSSFNLRLVRLDVQGKCFKDFAYRLQMEVNGEPGSKKGPRIVDAFVEWQKWDFLRIKLGQYKRSFGFENPMHPLNVGFGSYSQLTTKLLFTDRCGAPASNGRDIGIQAQGDFFPAADGHKWLHYQVGVFNGQGTNVSDKDNHKDVIGGLWISPLKNLRIGGFGWNGKYTNANYTATDTVGMKSCKRIRWGVGVDYESDWVVRSEYMSSVGGKVTNRFAADRSDAWYVTVGAPLCKNFKLYGRWDCYRDTKEWNSLKQNYGLAANYELGKHLVFQLNYAFTNDRTARDAYYNSVDVQVAARF